MKIRKLVTVVEETRIDGVKDVQPTKKAAAIANYGVKLMTVTTIR